MEKLLQTASSRLGMKPEHLMSALEKGDMNGILANMKPDDKQKIKNVLENGSTIEKLMKSPQAAAMMKQMNSSQKPNNFKSYKP